MNFLYHVFGIIFYIVWSIIGAVLLVIIALLFMFKPWTALSSSGGLSSITGMVSQLGGGGGVSDLLKSVQNKGGIKESYSNLPKTTQDCLKNQMGEPGLNDLLSGKTQLNAAVMLQAVKCLR